MKPAGNNRVFWLGSLVAHGLLFVVLFFSSASEKIFKSTERKLKPEIVRKDEKLAEVVDQVRDLAMDRMQAQLELLEEGRERMHADFNILNAHYQPFKDAQLETVRVRFQQAAQATMDRQARILGAIKAATEGGAETYDLLREAYDHNRARIFAGQEEIRRALLLTAAKDAALVESQAELDRLQADAFEAVAAGLAAHEKRMHEAGVLEAHTPKIEAAKVTHEAAADALSESDSSASDQKERVKRLHRNYLDQFYRGRMIEGTMEKLAKQRDASVREALELQQQVNTNQQSLVDELLARFESDPVQTSNAARAGTSKKDRRRDEP